MFDKDSDYGCVRFHKSVFSRLATDAGNKGCMGADGSIQPPAFAASEQTMMVYLDSVLDGHDGKMPAENVVLARALSQQALLHALYISAGRQVFQFTPAILDEFKRTDLSETPVGKLSLPYAAGFLHFGRQSDLQIDDWWRDAPEFVDGAYFHCGPNGYLTIQLTLSRPDGSWSKLSGPFFFIPETMLHLPAHEVIDKTLDADASRIVDGSPHAEAIGSAIQEWDTASRPVLHATLSQILNALFYLDAYGADSDPIVPDNAPRHLQELYDKAVKSAKYKEIRSARNVVMAEGFSVVRLCGGELKDHPKEQEDSSGRSVRTHWRRGHWRMQPCGPQLSQIKRLWVRPVLVGKEAGTPIKGHRYVVEAKDG